MAKLLVRSVLLLSLTLTACKGKGGDPKYADVDCAKMVDHIDQIRIDAGVKANAKASDLADARKQLADQRPTMIAACEKEKPTKKMTVAQYDCVMKAPTLEAMGACASAE